MSWTYGVASTDDPAMPLIDGLPDRDAAESALADYLESYPDDLNDDLIVVRIESDR